MKAARRELVGLSAAVLTFAIAPHAFAQTADQPATAAQPAPAQLPPVEVVGKKQAAKKSAGKKQAVAKKATAQPVSAAPVPDDAPPQAGRSGAETASSPVSDYAANVSATGSKTDTPLGETPQSVSVVGAEQIRDQSARTIQESLRYMPGVLADGFGFDSRGDYFLIRGIAGAKFLDGLRTSYGYYVNESALETYNLERVEVLRGPASMLYGQSTTGGIVNAVSKRPLDFTHREVSVEYGSFDFKQTKADLTGPLTSDGKWLYRIVGVARDADTQVNFVENDRLFIAPSLTYRPTKDTTITALTTFRDDHSGSTQQFLPPIGTLTPNRDGDRLKRSAFLGEPGDYFDTQAQSASLIVDHRFNDVFSMHHGSRYTHTNNDYDSTYPAILTQERFFQINSFLTVGLPGGPYTTFPFDPSTSPFLDPAQTLMARARTIRFTETDVFNTDSNITAKFATGPLQHKVTGGYDYTDFDSSGRKSGTLVDNLILPSLGLPFSQLPFNIYDPVYGQNNGLFEFETGAFTSNPSLYAFSERQRQHGIYIQDQLKLGPWIAVLGLRRDWLTMEGSNFNPRTGSADTYDTSDAATTGRAGLMYAFDSGLTPYVSYSTSFNPLPGTVVRASLTDPTLSAASPLQGEQIEAGFKYQPVGMPLMISAAVYELTEKDRVVQPDILADPLQGADVKVRGFEFEAAGAVTENLKLIAAYSYTDAEYERYEYYDYNEGTAVEGVPKHQASLWGIYTLTNGLFKGLSFGAGVRYVGSTTDVGRRFVGPAFVDTELYEITSPSHTLFDAMVAYETDTWRWQLSAQNLEDEYVVQSCTADRGDCAIGQSRTIITGLTYKF